MLLRMAKPLQSQRLSERLSQEEHVFQVMRGWIRKKFKEEIRGKWRMAKPMWLEPRVWNEAVETRHSKHGNGTGKRTGSP